MNVIDDKTTNINTADSFIKEAVKAGTDIIVLPEMWNCPYSNDYFKKYAEVEGGKTYEFLSKMADTLNVYIVGGSIPEIENDKIYNTSYIFDRNGKMIGKHRKIHLFDIDIKDGIKFMESETLTAGEKATVVETEFGKIGVGICFDVRFPELFRKMTLEGAKLIILPGAFNMTTGPAHWELTIRARALDNQVYFAACSPARSMNGHYIAFGNSCVSNPWGEFCAKTDANESIAYADIDFSYVDAIREQLPLLKARKVDAY
jgi:predicted amidohydrolase